MEALSQIGGKHVAAVPETSVVGGVEVPIPATFKAEVKVEDAK